MADTPNGFPEELSPGSRIEFGDITQLHAFEDVIAPIVDPYYRPEHWEARVALRELLRVPKFNGRIGNIALHVMDEPYEQLMTASRRGWKIAGGSGNHARTASQSRADRAKFIGFDLEATGSSTGRKEVYSIQSKLWYAPVPRGIRDPRDAENKRYDSSDPLGRGILRIVVTPTMEGANKALSIHQDARRISYLALRKTLMSRPISTGMRD